MTSKQMKRLILIVIVIVLLTIALIWGLKPQLSGAATASVTAVQSGAPVIQNQYAANTSVTAKPQSDRELLKASQQRRPQYRLDEQRLTQALHQQTIMQHSDAQTVAQHFSILNDTQLKDGRAFVQYDPYIIEGKSIGDHIKIDIPNTGQSYDGKVTDIEQVDSDIVRWRGDLDGVNGQMSNFTVTQTMKDQYAIAVFHTPTGEYILESKNGYGWVTSGSAEALHDDAKDHAH
ncbi:metalloprotease secretion chaperone CpaB [Aquirhabdus sp.]|uniref:metalloprotease secretion chaperone CpaB n=1 Tax=Aquirhabdus sp. TaxID=2824160 RepID=UPI00396C6BCB